jgi:transposase InsO family protein
MTAAEIAALKLPGLPATKQGMILFADRNGWNTRPRAGRGGGVEYDTSRLPLPARFALAAMEARESAAQIQMGALPISTAEAAGDEVPTTEVAVLRRDARLVITGLFRDFLARSRLAPTLARQIFCDLYNLAGETVVDGEGNHVAREGAYLVAVPAWVRKAKARISPNSIRNWQILAEEGRAGRLAGAYKGRPKGGTLGQANGGEVATFIGAVLLHAPHLCAEAIRDQVRERFGDQVDVVVESTGEVRAVEMPPIRTFQRFVAAWKDENAALLKRETDPDGFKNSMRISGRNMNAWVTRPNMLWEIDASPADALLTDGRYSVYVVVDIYTRRMIVLVTKTPRTEAVLALIRKAILAWGVPEIIRTDNGSDFSSRWAVSAIAGLGIKIDVCDPYSPWQKGTVERHIGTLQHSFMELLPGYVGHSVADRKKIEARKEFSKRLGQSDAKAFEVQLTAASLQALADEWCGLKYANRAHAGLKGKTPFEMITTWIGPLKRIENERALDLFLAPIAGRDGFKQVTKFGIKYDQADFRHIALVPGTRVFCRHDPADMGRLVVYEEDKVTFLCVAECAERLGKDPGEAVRELRVAQKARLDAEVAPLKREIARMKPRDMIDRALEVARRDHGTVIALPKRSETHTSPGLDGAAEAARVMDGRAPERTREPEIRPEARIAHFEAPKSEIQLKRERWARAQAIEVATDEGRPVSPEDAVWLARYVRTPEYQGFAMTYGSLAEA